MNRSILYICNEFRTYTSTEILHISGSLITSDHFRVIFTFGKSLLDYSHCKFLGFRYSEELWSLCSQVLAQYNFFPPCWIHVHVICFVFTDFWRVTHWRLSWLLCGYDRFISHALTAEKQGATRKCSTVLEKDFVWGCEKHLPFGYIFSSKINRYLKFPELLFFFDLSVSLTWIELTLLCWCLLLGFFARQVKQMH